MPITLECIHDLQICGPGHYKSLGDDPQFSIPNAHTFSRWVLFECVGSAANASLSPRFYADFGAGPVEVKTWTLRSTADRRRGILHLPAGLKTLRFDPLDVPGPFHIQTFELKRMFAWQALLRLLPQTRFTAQACWKGFKLFLGGRWRQLAHEIRQRQETLAPDRSYTHWISCFDSLSDEDRLAIQMSQKNLAWRGLISVLMPVCDPPPDILRRAIASVRQQLYSNWELCIADDASKNPEIRKILENMAQVDPRIRVMFRTSRGHISSASNDAMALASGEFIALLDHDDELAEHALYLIACTIAREPTVNLIYSDEDKITENGVRFDPYFKPDWNPELYLSQDFISHLGVYRLSLVRELGGFRPGYEGNQDYDLALRVIEKSQIAEIQHVPFVLYHWRTVPGSTSVSIDAKDYVSENGRRALQDHFLRTGRSAEARFDASGQPTPWFPDLHPEPRVSIIIPNRDRPELIRSCMAGLLQRTRYQNFEILLVDNDSRDSLTLSSYEEFQQQSPRIRLLHFPGSFNYSAINNYAAREAAGDYLMFLNNDVDVINPDWLVELMKQLVRPGVGTVGARLYYADRTLQHAGVIMGFQGVAGHAHGHLPEAQPGYFRRAHLMQNFSALTGACLGVPRRLFEETGGFDAENLPIDFSDVDLCLRLGELGYRHIWVPSAELFHYESRSRGNLVEQMQHPAFFPAVHFMKEKWRSKMHNDPSYNPNLDLGLESFSLAFPPRIQRPWR